MRCINSLDKLNSNGIANNSSAPESNDDSVSSINMHSNFIVEFFMYYYCKNDWLGYRPSIYNTIIIVLLTSIICIILHTLTFNLMQHSALFLAL